MKARRTGFGPSAPQTLDMALEVPKRPNLTLVLSTLVRRMHPNNLRNVKAPDVLEVATGTLWVGIFAALCAGGAFVVLHPCFARLKGTGGAWPWLRKEFTTRVANPLQSPYLDGKHAARVAALYLPLAVATLLAVLLLGLPARARLRHQGFRPMRLLAARVSVALQRVLPSPLRLLPGGELAALGAWGALQLWWIVGGLWLDYQQGTLRLAEGGKKGRVQAEALRQGAARPPLALFEEAVPDALLTKVAVLFGVLAMLNLAVLMLPVTRGSPLLAALCIGYDRATAYHRAASHSFVATLALHLAGFLQLWHRQGRVWEQLTAWPTARGVANLPGFLSFLAAAAVWLTSRPQVRRRAYWVFQAGHLLFPAVLLLACMHYTGILWWLLPGVALYCVDRAAATWLSRGRAPLLRAAAPAPGLAELRIGCGRGAGPRGAAASAGGLPEPLQYVWVNVPEVSALSWHPYSVAGVHPAPSADADASFDVLIKQLGPWSKQVCQLARDAASGRAPAMEVRVDGPYGPAERSWQRHPVIVLVAGGVGVAPLRAVLHALKSRRGPGPRPQSVHLVWAMRARAELAMLGDDLLEWLVACGPPPNDAAALGEAEAGRKVELSSESGEPEEGSPALPQVRLHLYVTRGVAGGETEVQMRVEAPGDHEQGAGTKRQGRASAAEGGAGWTGQAIGWRRWLEVYCAGLVLGAAAPLHTAPVIAASGGLLAPSTVSTAGVALVLMAAGAAAGAVGALTLQSLLVPAPPAPRPPPATGLCPGTLAGDSCADALAPTCAAATVSVREGRPNLAALLREIQGRHVPCAEGDGHGPGGVGVYVSGPPTMVEAVQEWAQGAVVAGADICLYAESFEL